MSPLTLWATGGPWIDRLAAEALNTLFIRIDGLVEDTVKSRHVPTHLLYAPWGLVNAFLPIFVSFTSHRGQLTS
jgi:hypothetical protein